MLLSLKTLARRLVLPVVVLLVWAPAAHAWSWPVQGPVLRPFVYDEAHPYTAGQHRGIDIGADSAGQSVVAPAAGIVSFAGSVPTSGKSVTIQTADGYSVTLTHLGSILVVKGATVAEQDAVGTIGPSGTPELEGSYVHLGIRATADPNGYLDPLQFLPPVSSAGSTGDDPTTSQPGSSGAGTPVAQPPVAAAATPARAPRGSTARKSRTRVSHHDRGRAQEPRSETQPQQSSGRSATRSVNAETRVAQHAARAQSHRSRPARPVHRPLVEAATPSAPMAIDGDQEVRPGSHAAGPPLTQPAYAGVLPLILNGAAALVALAAAFAAGRRRRYPPGGAQVLPLTQRILERRAA